MKVVKIQLSPSPSQKKAIGKQLEEHRSLYNTCLSKKSLAWKDEKRNVSCFDLIKSEVRILKSSGAISNYSSLQQTVRRLDKAYQSFFKKGGFPRFKSKDRFRTISYGSYGDGCKIKNDRLYLQNVGLVKCLHLRFPQKIQTLSVTKDGDKYYVSLGYEYKGDTDATKANKSIGLDFGLKNFLTTSDGDSFRSPKELKRSLKEIGKLHRRLHRAEKGSKLRKKHKNSVSKCQRKIANRRKDFNHKLSRKIVNENKVIVCEDIKLADLVSEISNINRTYADVAIGQFRQFLTYKAENAGRILMQVDPAYTSQECSSCGRVAKKSIKQRTHECECGCKLDRDHNAAINILRRGLASLSARTDFSFG